MDIYHIKYPCLTHLITSVIYIYIYTTIIKICGLIGVKKMTQNKGKKDSKENTCIDILISNDHTGDKHGVQTLNYLSGTLYNRLDLLCNIQLIFFKFYEFDPKEAAEGITCL